MTVRISDRLYKKSTMRDLSGNIINLIDETDGGDIIRNRRVVNPEKWERIQQQERDRIEAAKASSFAVSNPNAPERNINPANTKKIEELEKKVGDIDNKLDAILKALNK